MEIIVEIGVGVSLAKIGAGVGVGSPTPTTILGVGDTASVIGGVGVGVIGISIGKILAHKATINAINFENNEIIALLLS